MIVVYEYLLKLLTTLTSVELTTRLHMFFKDFEDENGRFRNELPSNECMSNDHPQYLSIGLSKSCDKANQWLCYGDRGKGVMLGFDKDYLIHACEMLKGFGEDIAFRDVIYTGTADYGKFVSELCAQVEKCVLSGFLDNENSWHDVEDLLLEWMAFVKGKEFLFEREQRISLRKFVEIPLIDKDFLAHHSSDGQDEYFLRIPKRGLLKSVVIGPCSNVGASEVASLLHITGFDDVKVSKSESKLAR